MFLGLILCMCIFIGKLSVGFVCCWNLNFVILILFDFVLNEILGKVMYWFWDDMRVVLKCFYDFLCMVNDFVLVLVVDVLCKLIDIARLLFKDFV